MRAETIYQDAIAPPSMQAVALASDGRDRGPLLVNQAGRRMTAYNVQELVADLAHHLYGGNSATR